MIKELTTTEVMQDCPGTQTDGMPCPNINTIQVTTLILGAGMTTPLIINCGNDSSIAVWAKASGKNLVLLDPGMTTAATTAAEATGVVTVTLAHNGTDIVGTIQDVVTAINTTTTVKDAIYAIGLGDKNQPAVVASSALNFFGTGSNKNSIKLPICPNCGSVEAVNRTWDKISPRYYGTLQDKHRRAVNYLGKQLKMAGNIDFFAKAVIDAEMTDPPDMPFGSPPFVVF
jgi:hypothetical protein